MLYDEQNQPCTVEQAKARGTLTRLWREDGFTACVVYPDGSVRAYSRPVERRATLTKENDCEEV